MAVSDIPPAKIVNAQTRYDELLYYMPLRDLYRWDSRHEYMTAVGYVAVDGQVTPPSSQPPFNVAQTGFLDSRYFGRVAGSVPLSALARGVVAIDSIPDNTLYYRLGTGTHGVPISEQPIKESVPVRGGASGTFAVSDPTLPEHVATKGYVDKLSDDAFLVSKVNAGSVPVRSGAGARSFIPYAGDARASTLALRTATGALVGATPTQATELTTKEYVDKLANDTGTRQLASLTPPAGVSITSYKLRRFGPLVELYVAFSNTSGAAIPTVTFPAADYLPVGFRPAEQRLFAQSLNGGSVTGVFAVGAGTTGVRSFTVAAGAVVQASINWMTQDAWPATLPGVVA